MQITDPAIAVVRRPVYATTAVSPTVLAYWTLRIGAALCFIGHGAFGFITKAAWVPYFGVVGIPERWAWMLMPIVGSVDVLAGMAVLFAPRALPVVYMAGWATWTALLRPLAGESEFETLERAGNYGVPLALLLMTTRWVARPAVLLAPLHAPDVLDESIARRIRHVLTWTTATLLVGHGALGVLEKGLLASHYAAIGLSPATAPVVGWIEIALAIAVLLRPAASLLVGIAVWKLATESLFVVAGAPIWEFVERAGSYAAPLALAFLVARRNEGLSGESVPRLR